MKVVVVSDSHGNLGVLKRIILREEPFDLLVHLGDGLMEAVRLQELFGFRLDGVAGNNDPREMFPEELCLKLGKNRCLFTHGHLFQAHRDLKELSAHARRRRADQVFFGHTHCIFNGMVQGVHLLNPGSVCNHLTKNPSYLVVLAEPGEFKIEKRSVNRDSAVEQI